MNEKNGGTCTAKDFAPPTEPRWCPGCGNNAILRTIQRLLPDIGVEPEKYVFVSGIGCSSRFPYYIDTYGFHGLHGRAPAIATGVKLANPDLKVWVITGDGDALGIGGNHFIHLLRRNPDMVVLLFNNRIYGLTKGQTSPTTGIGVQTKSSPGGSTDFPFNPVALALGASGSFVARVIYNDTAMMTRVFKAAIEHRGTSFVEIYDNCRIFADKAFDYLTEKEARAENQLHLEHGKPLIFANGEKGMCFNKLIPAVCRLKDECGKETGCGDVIIYDETNVHMAQAIASLDHPDYPVPLGIFYRSERACFEDFFHPEERKLDWKRGPGAGDDDKLQKIFGGGQSWEVK